VIGIVSSADYIPAHPVKTMTPDELAFRLIDKEADLQIIDVRLPEEFILLSLLNSRNVQIRDFFGKEWDQVFGQRHQKKEVVGNYVGSETTACLRLERLGYENCVVLE
jgi:rhodanese-related sulfurtransferase